MYKVGAAFQRDARLISAGRHKNRAVRRERLWRNAECAKNWAGIFKALQADFGWTGNDKWIERPRDGAGTRGGVLQRSSVLEDEKSTGEVTVRERNKLCDLIRADAKLSDTIGFESSLSR